MLRSTQYENELIGSVEDLNISNIFQSLNPIRNSSDNILELADSINKIGLLTPIMVRSINSGFEVVAGSRRFAACKKLGWKRIPCHIVELDDKCAFEASIIENIQRNTLNVLEEGTAFRKYVNEFGWGAASELAHRLSKSSSYVSKKMRLLELPNDVLQLICESEISVSTGEELLSIKQSEKQSKYATMVVDKAISSKSLREIIKEEKNQLDDFSFSHTDLAEEKIKLLKSFDKSIIALRIAINKLAIIIEKIEDNWILHEILMNHKNTIHSQIDVLIRERKKAIKFFSLRYL
jgi:ParB family transcriptional regulator, chromosome partitioning protein